MSSSSKLPSIKEVGDGTILNNESHLEHDSEEEDVDEDEDMDFNPFLIDSPSFEASSSLSSDNEILDDGIIGQLQECSRVDEEFGEESVMQICNKETKLVLPSAAKKRKTVMLSPQETETIHMRENRENNGTNIVNTNDEDAISKRTRARYSLASFTLDELEVFLQETDDEDDLPNVDDEEEYRKFLAAVLQGGDDDSQIRQENENVEDEDEDNDADFELELEEALESDLEENCGGDIRRPETRLNKCRKASDKQMGRVLRQANRPLRPLLPNTPVGSYPTLIPKTAPQGPSTSVHNYSNGFTQQQLVQLHCLIHEHVQLLIQVFSLSVLDPCRQHIASQVKDLISLTLQKREEVISWKQAQYPFCGLLTPYTYSSTPDGLAQSSTENGLTLSVLDVAPLTLVEKYMDEVSIAVTECQRQRIESSSAGELKKEPLFPFHNFQTLAEDVGVERGSTEVEPIKKTLAAVLVEKTKKQSIAPAPKEIAGLARRFLSLFNPALFPHKPPPPTVVNRVLFTDSEDELLALGLMECNSDWEAIQQRYLPCKSKHQIFVRQKNRASSKAPDNPIKVVRRMKASPLTQEEMARIKEGLKIFKLDWMSVWRYVVPYRDPSLLPRQWRIANGTQKSYKSTDDKKARRRLYELNRKRNKPATLTSWQTSPDKEECQTDNAGGENNSGDDCVGREDGAYVHEAFLADWRPGTFVPNSSNLPFSNHFEGHRPHALLSQTSQQIKNCGQANPNISASGRSHLVPWPYRSRRKKNAHVVKLAPDLPPINLPPSVRVISQSAFKGCNTSKEVIVKTSFERSNSSQHPGGSHVASAKCDARDKNQSDLQMHPLLFQASGDCYLPYYPLSCGNTSSNSFNFFPHFQPQLNPSLLNNPQFINKSSNESASAVGIDFHPLLQRTDEVATDSVPQLPENLELFGTSSAQLHTVPNNFTQSFNVTEKANELDLDIHLSLSRSEMATENRDFDQLYQEPPSASIQNRISNNIDYGVHLKAGSGDSIDVGDQSLLGIVMEQEELSDSEEEIGEHVEFECEEMDDSEGDEGSDTQKIEELSNSKEAVGTASGKQKGNDTLSLNLNSSPRNDPKISSEMTGVNHPTEKSDGRARPTRSCKKPSLFQVIHEEERAVLDLLALNPSKGPRKKLRRNSTYSSSSGSCKKGDSDLITKPRNNTGLKVGPSGKVDSNPGSSVKVDILE